MLYLTGRKTCGSKLIERKPLDVVDTIKVRNGIQMAGNLRMDRAELPLVEPSSYWETVARNGISTNWLTKCIDKHLTVIIGKEWISHKRHDRLDASHYDEGQLEPAYLEQSPTKDGSSQLGNVHHGPRETLRNTIRYMTAHNICCFFRLTHKDFSDRIRELHGCVREGGRDGPSVPCSVNDPKGNRYNNKGHSRGEIL